MNIPATAFDMINILIIVILLINIFLGYKKGLIYQVLTLLSFFGAFLIAYLLTPIFSEHIMLFKIEDTFLIDMITSQILNYFVWFVLILIVTKIIFALVIQFSKWVSKLPLIGFANKVTGAIFGVLNGTIWIIIISALLCTPVFKNGQEIRDNTIIKPFNDATNRLIIKASEMIDFDQIKIEHPEYNVDDLRNQVENWLIEEGILDATKGQ